MPVIHLAALFGILLFICCYPGFALEKKKTLVSGDTGGRRLAGVLFVSALLVRLVAGARSEGFGTDISCFMAWAERMHTVGAPGFYSPEVFTDYPPGYMYVLGIIGGLRQMLGIAYGSSLHMMLIKLPAVLCDLACGWLLYREAKERLSECHALFVCAAWLFNPVILLNSCFWGQVDSVFTLLLVLMCLSLVKERLFPAYVAFFAGVLLKPQMLIFSPVLLAGVADQLFLRGFSLRRLGKNLLSVLLCLAGFLCLCLPFGIGNVWEQYFSTVASYPYAAVNACNFWGMLGLNWISQDNTFLGIPYKFYGYAFIVLIVALVLVLSLRHRDNREKYPFLAAVLILTLFVFSVRMHERYLYPGLILLLFAYVYRPVKSVWICHGCFSLLHFYNTAFVLFFYDPQNYDRKTPLLLLVSAGMVLTAVLLHRSAIPQYFSGKDIPLPGHGSSSRQKFPESLLGSPVQTDPAPRPSRGQVSLGWPDLICMAAVTLVYGCFALYDLGDTAAPESSYEMECGDSISVQFDHTEPGGEVCSIAYYIAPGHNQKYTLETGGASSEITFSNVFTWQKVTLDTPGSDIRLTLTGNSASLLELVFLDREGNAMTPVNASDYPALFDEQNFYPERSSFRDSMYFDEIYHGRTAYEFLHGLPTYETTHPPLGKILISLGVALFGMNPFGWRIVGTVFGIFMVPVIYLFGKRMTENTCAATLACILFSFDFMHFTQTRIATIDVYITFFVMLMYYFMYRYCQKSFYDTSLSRTFLPLGACGICMGLGIACKWTGVYAGAGLAVLFFATLYRRYQEYCYAKARPKDTSNGISHAHILRVFLPHTKKTIYFCIVFFVAIPALIYLLSYIPFVSYSGEGLFGRLIHNQTDMFRYHSTLEATHDFSSPWYEWPILRRPVWYFSSVVTGSYKNGGLREGISAFGNPLVWWAGIPAFFYTVWLWFWKKDRTAAFLAVGYLAQYLPWFFVTRITFIYHYFPSVAFVVLMIVHCLLQAKKKMSARKFLALASLYGIAVIALFLLFYPVLSGRTVDAAFVDRWLRWFQSWVLVLE